MMKDILQGRRWVAYIPPTAYDEEQKGYRVSFVIEGEAFHRPTGGGDVMPWYWGPTLADAESAAVAYNKELGIDEDEAFMIVARSMAMKRSA